MRKISSLQHLINIKKTIFFIIIVSSILSVFFLIMPITKFYSLIKIVPFSYSVFLFVFMFNKKIIGFGSLSVIILYFFRMVIMPIIVAYGNFYQSADFVYYSSNFNLACLMMVLESFTVLISLYIFQLIYFKKINNLKPINNNIFTGLSFKNNTFIYIILLITLTMSIIILILFPDLKNYFQLIWENNNQYNLKLSLLKESIVKLGPIYYIFKKIVEFIRPLIFFFTITFIITNQNIKHKLFYSLIVVGVSISVITVERIHSYFITIICLYNILLNFNYKTIYLKFFSIVMSIFMLIYGLNKFSSSGNPKSVARAYQIYFGGPVVMAIGLGIDADFPIKYFLNEIYNGSMLLTGLFGQRVTSYDLINSVVNESAKGTFFSFIVQSKFYFGILAPLTIIFVVWIITKTDFLAETSSNFFYKMVYQYISFSIATFLIMYSFTMVFNYVLYTILFYLFMIFIDKRLDFKLEFRK